MRDRRLDREGLLRARAETLAARRSAPGPGRPVRAALIFRIGTERFAVELAAVGRVVGLAGLAGVPGAPETILGVMLMLGEIGTVWDLGALLGLPRSPAPSGHVMILKTDLRVGLRSDYVEGVREIGVDEAAEAGPMRHLKGIAPEGIAVLDVESILAELAEGQRTHREET